MTAAGLNDDESFATDLQTCEELAFGDFWVASVALAAGDTAFAEEYLQEGMEWVVTMHRCTCGELARPFPRWN